MLDRVEAMVYKSHADMMAGFDRLLEKINETTYSMTENAEVALGVYEMEKDFGAVSEAYGRDEDCGSEKDRQGMVNKIDWISALCSSTFTR